MINYNEDLLGLLGAELVLRALAYTMDPHDLSIHIHTHIFTLAATFEQSSEP